MTKTLDKRHLSRIIVLQKLFERQFRHNDISKPTDNEFSNNQLIELIADEARYDKKLADRLLKGVIEYKEKADTIIAKLAPEWPLEQINKTDLQILRIAITEGFIEELTPKKVTIDEAVELAKEFGGQPSGTFVNGVLGTLLNEEKKFATTLKTHDNQR